MEFTDTKRDSAIIVALNGKLDATTATKLQAHLDDLIENGERKMVFDLTNLEFVSSAGLRVFLSTAKKLKAAGGRLALACVQSHIGEVLKISGFSAIFPDFGRVEEAVAAAGA